MQIKYDGPVTLFFYPFSSLVFAGAGGGDILRYFLDRETQEVIYDNDKSPVCLSVDGKHEVIYWIEFIQANDSHSLQRTYFNGSTSQIKYYPGSSSSIRIAIGEDDFYVMDSPRGRVDRFDRITATLQHSFDLSDTPTELTVVEGKIIRAQNAHNFFLLLHTQTLFLL